LRIQDNDNIIIILNIVFNQTVFGQVTMI